MNTCHACPTTDEDEPLLVIAIRPLVLACGAHQDVRTA